MIQSRNHDMDQLEPDPELPQADWKIRHKLHNRKARVPGVGHHLKVTTSRGQVYLLDQFRERVPPPIKNALISVLSELVGTFIYMITGLGGTSAAINLTANDPNHALRYLFVSLAWGMATLTNAWLFYRISGGLFSPAVTFAMVMIRAIHPVQGLVLVIAQMVACIAAAGVLIRLVPIETVVGVELAETTTATQGLFIEMFATAQVVFAVFMLATEKHKATYIAPVGIGIAVFASVLWSSCYTGAALNPARAFATAAVHGEFPGYHWIYRAGPLLGAFLSTSFYLLVRKLEYWTVNPGADDSYAPGTGEWKIGDQIVQVANRETPKGRRMSG